MQAGMRELLSQLDGSTSGKRHRAPSPHSTRSAGRHCLRDWPRRGRTVPHGRQREHPGRANRDAGSKSRPAGGHALVDPWPGDLDKGQALTISTYLSAPTKSSGLRVYRRAE
jgi:hypothetical protein